MNEQKVSQSGRTSTDHKNNNLSSAKTIQTYRNNERRMTNWEYIIPWFLTATSTLVLCAIGWFLSENLIWLREEALNLYDNNNLSYRSYTYFMYVSSIRRSVGLFSGIALMFLGIGVSFYTIKSQTNLKVGAQKLTFSLLTASPGIIAMVLGVFLIAHNTSSKDEIPIYSTQLEAAPELSGKLPDFQQYPKEGEND